MRVQNQRSALNRKKQELGSLYNEMQAVLAEKCVLKTQLHALSGTPIIHRRDVGDQNDARLGHEPTKDGDIPLGAASNTEGNKDKAAHGRDKAPTFQPKEADQRPKRGRRPLVDNHAEGGGQAPKVTPLVQPLASLPEQPAVQDDDDAKVRERLRQLRAQRQQDSHS